MTLEIEVELAHCVEDGEEWLVEILVASETSDSRWDSISQAYISIYHVLEVLRLKKT